MAEEKLILNDGSEFDLNSLYADLDSPPETPTADPEVSSATTLSAEEYQEYIEYKKTKEQQEEVPVKPIVSSNSDKTLKQLMDSNFILTQKFENQKYEDSIKTQHPAFKVDENRVFQDKILGIYPAKSRENQLKEYIKNVAEIGRMYNQGHYKLNQETASAVPGNNNGLPEGFKDFDPSLINDAEAMNNLRRYKPSEHKEYIEKYRLYSKLDINLKK